MGFVTTCILELARQPFHARSWKDDRRSTVFALGVRLVKQGSVRVVRGLIKPAALMAWLSIRSFCRLAMRKIDVQASGLEHVPRSGPVILAARHYHYSYDGIVIYALVPRQLRTVAALDWLPRGPLRGFLQGACRVAGWPAILREPIRGDNDPETERERRLLLLHASREAVELLREGNALLIFPEAYPVVDPHPTLLRLDGEMLPFQQGALRFAELAARQSHAAIPVVPVGLHYTPGRRWRLDLAFGEPLMIGEQSDLGANLAMVESEVRRLSGL